MNRSIYTDQHRCMYHNFRFYACHCSFRMLRYKLNRCVCHRKYCMLRYKLIPCACRRKYRMLRYNRNRCVYHRKYRMLQYNRNRCAFLHICRIVLYNYWLGDYPCKYHKLYKDKNLLRDYRKYCNMNSKENLAPDHL